MLSAFVLVDPTAPGFEEADRVRAIVKTLGALVELVVADIVADATVVTRPDAAIHGVEHSAGCTIVEDAHLGAGLARALPRARRETALVLTPAYAPAGTFRAEIELAVSGEGLKALTLVAEPETFLQRMWPGIAPVTGLVATRTALVRAAQSTDGRLASLAKALSARPMRTSALRL